MKLNLKLPKFRRIIAVRELVQEGESIPDWYGIAHADPMTGNGVAYIMPFHFLVRWARLAYYAFMLPRPAWWEVRFREMRQEGYKDGFTHGQASAEYVDQREIDRAYNKGWNAALAKIEELAEAEFGEGEAGPVEE